MDLEPGKKLSHYKILEKLGEGGMGVVFRAHDDRLKRDVAIKVLRGGRWGDQSLRERFRLEAFALSRVNHPNVAVIYEFGESHRVQFIAMEYIPGITLGHRMRSGPVAQAEAIDLAIQIADGLSAAHVAGVVHRDLKPANVRLLNETWAKIVDFGLAKRLPRPSDSDPRSLTESDKIVGTVPYMAPEQIRGQCDVRTDVYALGAVLYQMATGQRPFPQEDMPRLIYAIAYEPPPPVRSLNPGVSPPLERLILRALEKEPDLRYATAQEIAVALKEIRDLIRSGGSPHAAPARPRPIRTLAVLPLEEISGSSDGDYFADGITEAIISDLSKLKGLGVTGRTSIMRYKRTTKPIPEIARELGVDSVLEGTVQRVGDRVRTGVRLVRAAPEESIWAETYDRRLMDLLTLQSDIARSVAREIELQMKPSEPAFAVRSPAVDPEALVLYMTGRQQWNRRDIDGLRAAIRCFEGVVAKSPDFALAFAGLADCYAILGNWSVLPPRDVYPKAKKAALRALALDPNLGEAHVALAFAEYLYDWKWEQAEQGFRRAIELSPSYAQGHLWYGNFLSAMGRHDEAIAEARRGQELDPLSPIISAIAAWIHYEAGRYEETVERCRRDLEMNPIPQYYLFMGLALTQLGEYDEAIASFERGVSLSGGITEMYAGLGFAYGVSKRTAEAYRVLDELDRLSKSRYVPPYSRSIVHIGLGERAKALDLLEQACEERNTWLILLGVEPLFNSIREEPRFQRILDVIGLPSQQTAAV
ncbi:MAG TPA: protein kinase [Candidatus Eisenbacteria bacterium]|nr:protein kinase [Candidatus Eisenbacteria bacterium]